MLFTLAKVKWRVKVEKPPWRRVPAAQETMHYLLLSDYKTKMLENEQHIFCLIVDLKLITHSSNKPIPLSRIKTNLL